MLWDIASANPDLRLPAKMSDVIEEGVAAVEELVSIMRAEASNGLMRDQQAMG